MAKLDWNKANHRAGSPSARPTARQVDYLKGLMRHRGIPFEMPETQREAHEAIDFLLKAMPLHSRKSSRQHSESSSPVDNRAKRALRSAAGGRAARTHSPSS